MPVHIVAKLHTDKIHATVMVSSLSADDVRKVIGNGSDSSLVAFTLHGATSTDECPVGAVVALSREE